MDWGALAGSNDYDDEEGEEEELTDETIPEQQEESDSGEDERFDWGFEENEEIFNLKKLRFKEFTTGTDLKTRYRNAIAATGNLYTHQFIKNLRNDIFRITYFDKPYGEYHVQGMFINYIETVDIVGVQINYDLIYHLMENEEVLPRLKQIMLRDCFMKPKLLQMLCPLLEEAYYLADLNLSLNPLGDEGMKIIVKHLNHWTFLKSLNLFDTGITSTGLDSLGTLYLKQRVFLTKLNIGRNSFSNADAIKKFFRGISKKQAPIEVLVLQNCCLKGAEVASHFEEFLSSAPRLSHLDLSFNAFAGSESATSLARFFIDSKSLKELILNFNPFSDEAAQEMLNVVFDSRPNPHRKALCMEHITLHQGYFKEKWIAYNRPDLRVVIAGVRKMQLPPSDSFKDKLAKRINFLYFKARPKPKRDLVVQTIVEKLAGKNLKRVKDDEFSDVLLTIKNLDPPLVEELTVEYSIGRNRCDVESFIDLYKNLFPEKPKAPTKKKKKGKATKKEKKGKTTKKEKKK